MKKKSNLGEKPGKPWPAQVVKDIMKNYGKPGQKRILELLQKEVDPPAPKKLNPYGGNNLRI